MKSVTYQSDLGIAFKHIISAEELENSTVVITGGTGLIGLEKKSSAVLVMLLITFLMMRQEV